MRIAFVSPAFDQEQVLRRTVEADIELMDRLVIVNDGSTDRTGIIADQLAREHQGKIEVIHQTHGGIGNAVKNGFRLLLERDDVDAMGVLASDDQFDARLIPRFREILEEMPEVDVAKGSRFMDPEWRKETPTLRKWGTRGVSFAMQLALGYWGMSDVLHGYFLARTSIMRQMDIEALSDVPRMMAELRRLRATFALIPSPPRDGGMTNELPRPFEAVTGMVATRALAGPDRLGVALLALSVPTLGATLPFAAARLHRTSPKVTKLPR